MLLVLSPSSTVSRRRVLASAAALALFGATAAGCAAPPPPPEVDEIAAQLERARADSRLATEAAGQERGLVAKALTAVAAERSAHAQALSDELVRMRGAEAPTTEPSEQPTGTTAEPARPPIAEDAVNALRASAESATELAAKLTGYQAGLVASIAAACTAAYLVALAPPGGPR